ncbi:MAG: ROK family transcriptional regulator [Anaerolineaceae bacterium]|nr:ROK family transcriptional regulator [Anaerolineaceae bacterium]
MTRSNNILGSNINLVKSHNIRAILLCLVQNSMVSRVELAEKLLLSTTTITNLTSELLEQGIIFEEQVGSPEKRKSVGRPRRMLRLEPSARFAIGVHIGVGLIRVAITDLFAEIINSDIQTFDLDTPPEDVINNIVLLIEKAIKKCNIDRSRVIGVGVGASGLVNYENGINVFAPRLGWKNIPIQHILENHLDLPVCVDNNVRTMALAEAFFGIGRGTGVLAFVYGRIGVGSGIVVNRQVFRGSGAGAGEIGHTTILPHGGEICTCGNTGCLETLLSEPVWIRHAEELAAAHPESLLSKYLNLEDEQTSIERIFSAARDGDKLIQQFIENRACYLGIALANLVNVLNPEMIILGGMFAQGSDLILPIAEAKMIKTAFAGLGDKVRLETTSFGWSAGVVGAASLALTSYLYQQPEGI